MNSQLLDVGIHSQDVGTVLAAILAASSRPLTRVLEDLSGTKLRIQVLRDGSRTLTDAERFRLGADGIRRCRWRHGLLVTAADGTVAASTTLTWLPPRIPFDACRALDEGAKPAGLILGEFGMRREDRRALAVTDMLEEVTGQPMSVMSSATLSIDGVPVGVAEEFITSQFAESLA